MPHLKIRFFLRRIVGLLEANTGGRKRLKSVQVRVLGHLQTQHNGDTCCHSQVDSAS